MSKHLKYGTVLYRTNSVCVGACVRERDMSASTSSGGILARVDALFTSVDNMDTVRKSLQATLDKMQGIGKIPSSTALTDLSHLAAANKHEVLVKMEALTKLQNEYLSTKVDVEQKTSAAQAELRAAQRHISALEKKHSDSMLAASAAFEQSLQTVTSAFENESARRVSETAATRAAYVKETDSLTALLKQAQAATRDSRTRFEQAISDRKIALAALQELEKAQSKSTGTIADMEKDMFNLNAAYKAMSDQYAIADGRLTDHAVLLGVVQTDLRGKLLELERLHTDYRSLASDIRTNITDTTKSSEAEKVVADAKATNLELKIVELSATIAQITASRDGLMANKLAFESEHRKSTTDTERIIGDLQTSLAVARGASLESEKQKQAIEALQQANVRIAAACQEAQKAGNAALAEHAGRVGGLIGVTKLFYSSKAIVSSVQFDAMDSVLKSKYASVVSLDSVQTSMYNACIAAAQTYTDTTRSISNLSDTNSIQVAMGVRTRNERANGMDIMPTGMLTVRKLSDTASLTWVMHPPSKIPRVSPTIFGRYTTAGFIANRQLFRMAKGLTSTLIAIDDATYTAYAAQVAEEKKRVEDYITSLFLKYNIYYESATEADTISKDPTRRVHYILPSAYFTPDRIGLNDAGIRLINIGQIFPPIKLPVQGSLFSDPGI